ncbi:uncharacterized protein LOC111058413 [Nilaparvata lugens]|uniref:uncharacterized protein LOC111058413 n=1 Tax=Nilaparvata lugens TaxID=108931 RepID=UPI00193DD677|nr:uncharacterized protein LOC111058413 [Nilaparvata lugens]
MRCEKDLTGRFTSLKTKMTVDNDNRNIYAYFINEISTEFWICSDQTNEVGAAHVEESELAGEGCTACVLCLEYKVTRLCSPCGHANMCTACCNHFVAQECHYSVTNSDGSVEVTDIQLHTTVLL